MTLSGDGTITGLVAGGLPNATVTADDLASGAAVSNIGYTPTNQQAENINFRNRIINGDMRIDQRNAGSSFTVTNAGNNYTLDRWAANGESADGVFTVQQSSTAPTGFVNSALITTTTADASIGAAQFYLLRYFIEGYNVADLNWGTANAKTVTLSFWVRSSLTGTFGGAATNNPIDRSYPFSYSISVADTWEYKTITIAGDTTGTWLKDNGLGLRLAFSLGVGSDRIGTAGSWEGANRASVTGAVSVIGTLNATWYITGVQLEVGSVATPFERRPYGTELSLCQRYYIKYLGTGNNFASGANYGTSDTYPQLFFPVTMRAAPTFSFSGVDAFAVYSAGSSIGDTIGLGHGPTIFGHTITAVRSGLTSGYASVVTLRTNAFLAYSAEL
jgi:hypothetical protein